MPATLAWAEQALLQPTRAGGLYLSLGADITNGGVTPNPFLADALTGSLVFCGYPPADPTGPGDADIAALVGTPDPGTNATNWQKFLDIAEVKLLEGATLLIATKPTSVEWPDFTEQYAIDSLTAAAGVKLQLAKARWGYGVPTLGGGSVVVRQAPRPMLYPGWPYQPYY